MIRLSGILIGSMLAVAILILLIGVPKFPATESAIVTSPPLVAEFAPEPAAEPTSEANAEPEPQAAVESPAEPASGSQSERRPDSGLQDNSRDVPQSAAAVAAQPAPAPAAAEPEQALPETLFMQPDQHWYAFWSPFRSEIAANGFVAQLQRVTGFDYRVVKQKAGVYEVALAYSNDAEIPQMLEQISAATGLDIPES